MRRGAGGVSPAVHDASQQQTRVVKKLKRRFEPMRSEFLLACEFVLWAEADAGPKQSAATEHKN